MFEHFNNTNLMCFHLSTFKSTRKLFSSSVPVNLLVYGNKIYVWEMVTVFMDVWNCL